MPANRKPDRIKEYQPRNAAETQAIAEYLKRAETAMHGVQAAIGFELSLSHPELGDALNTVLKHITVGKDTAMAEHGALVSTLIDAGIIAAEDYYHNLALYAERELAIHTAEFQKRHPGTQIKFV